jgi:hypothetical protein
MCACFVSLSTARLAIMSYSMNWGVRMQRTTCTLYGSVNTDSGGQGHDGATSPKFDNILGLECMFSRCDLETPNLARHSSQIRRSSRLIGRRGLRRYSLGIGGDTHCRPVASYIA